MYNRIANILFCIPVFLFLTTVRVYAGYEYYPNITVQIISADGVDVSAMLQKADELVSAGCQLEAIQVLESVLFRDSRNEIALRKLGDLYAREGKPQQSIKCFKKLASIFPDDAELAAKLNQLSATNDKQPAIVSLQKTKPGNPSAHDEQIEFTNLHKDSNSQEQTWKQYLDILKLHPTNTVVMVKLAEYYFQQNKPETGIQLLSHAVELCPDSLVYRKKLAQQYSWQEMQKEAIVQYKEIIKRNVQDSDALKELAQLFKWSNQTQQSAALCKLLIKRDPDNSEYRTLLASVYMDLREYDHAEKQLEFVLTQNPADKYALMLLAEIQDRFGRWDRVKGNPQKMSSL